VSGLFGASRLDLVPTRCRRTNAAWGLGRVSHTNKVSGTVTALNYTYTYDDAALGSGVDIYIVDTGIHITHVCDFSASHGNHSD